MNQTPKLLALVSQKSGAVLAERVQVASSVRARTQGLLGRAELPQGEGLVIERCSMVHMFFMKFPLDVVFCSREWVVLAVVRNLRPWLISRWVPGAFYAVELPVGAAARIEVGERLNLRTSGSSGQ